MFLLRRYLSAWRTTNRRLTILAPAWQTICSLGPAELMENINVLLVNGDRGINKLIEAAVLDVCYNRGLVHFTRTSELSEFVRLGPSDGFGLIILVADHVVSTIKRQDSLVPFEEVLGAVRSVRRESSAPLIVVSASAERKDAILAAGAECAM